MEKTFQIKNKDKFGYSCDYFTATEDYGKHAAQCANNALAKKREFESIDVMRFFKGTSKATKTLTVAEYDKTTNKLVKNGLKFKLKLAYMETKFKGGNAIRKEWYEPVM